MFKLLRFQRNFGVGLWYVGIQLKFWIGFRLFIRLLWAHVTNERVINERNTYLFFQHQSPLKLKLETVLACSAIQFWPTKILTTLNSLCSCFSSINQLVYFLWNRPRVSLPNIDVWPIKISNRSYIIGLFNANSKCLKSKFVYRLVFIHI